MYLASGLRLRPPASGLRLGTYWVRPWTLQSLLGPGPTALSPPVRPVPRRLAFGSAIEPGF